GVEALLDLGEAPLVALLGLLEVALAALLVDLADALVALLQRRQLLLAALLEVGPLLAVLLLLLAQGGVVLLALLADLLAAALAEGLQDVLARELGVAHRLPDRVVQLRRLPPGQAVEDGVAGHAEEGGQDGAGDQAEDEPARQARLRRQDEQVNDPAQRQD